MKSGRQEHEGLSPDTTHTALGPHGDGTQGFSGDATTGVSARHNKNHSVKHALIKNMRRENNTTQ
jgi:hypothetical protein